MIKLVSNVTVLMRFPKVERSKWKCDIIEGLINKGYNVSIIFAYCSYFDHLKFGYKYLGNSMFSRRNKLSTYTTVNTRKIKEYFREKISVIEVGKENSYKAEKKVKMLNPDLLILLGTGIIRKNILKIPNQGTIHVHQGYLPKYRGVNTIEWSVYHNHAIYISAHFVSPGIDTGDIIKRIRISYNNHDDITSIREKCKNRAIKLIIETIEKISTGSEERIKQTKSEGNQYFEMHPFFLNNVERYIKLKE